MNTRDTFGFAAKGAWFEVDGKGYDIYKDPVTDDGTKKSLKGLVQVVMENNEYQVNTQCSWEQESEGILQTIFEDGIFYNQLTLTEIRSRLENII
jgi:nicotinamide phosphoribosyltransferase